MLALDHAFVCVDPEPGELLTLRRLGFTSAFSRRHTGQGTANELILFPQNYLELLFLFDRAEAEESLVRLDRRCDWRKSGASPFGVALRGPKSSVSDTSWVHYRPQGMSEGVWLAEATLEDPSLPLLFVFDQADAAAGGPASRDYAPALMQHACGASGIASLRVTGPGLGRVRGLPLPDNVIFSEADSPRMELEIEGREGPEIGIGPLLYLR
jgi:hypothetical protein